MLYIDKNMRADLASDKRITPLQIMDARQELLDIFESGEQGWLKILDDKKYWNIVKAQIKAFSKYKHLLVLGIGGSDLGCRAILEALRTSGSKTKIHFAGDTTDPDEIEAVFSQLDWKHTAINVISKSGGTLETMSVFFAAKERLEKAVGTKKASKAIICTTDPEKGALLDLAREKGYATLPVPQNIGGRFSTLTAVGLFPAALAGINISKILSGAVALRNDWQQYGGATHSINQFAAYHVAHYHNKRKIHVLFCYASALKRFATWYRQIWAESLGKTPVSGPTPIIAMGPADQHSQLQLFQDGPDDKVYTFLQVDSFRSKLRVSPDIASLADLSYAKNKSFQNLIQSALTGTSEALASQNKPVGILNIKKIDEASLGQLFVFYEIAVSITGLMQNINPFDQPGVEDSKQRVKKLLATS
jgi:glucose-6-phosphate isomerase